MKEPVFEIPAGVVVDIVLLNDDIGCLLDTGFSEESQEELRDTQERLAALLDKLEARRIIKEELQ